MSIDQSVKILDRTTPPHTLTLVLLAGMSALTMSIFLPSLNGMTVYFGTDYSVMQFAVSGYFIMTALLQLIIGPMSDRYGRRPVLLISLGLFVIATFGGILASNVWVFLGFRMLQASVASCMALSRAVVRDIYPADQAASKLGYVTMGMALVPMLGPVIGGVLDQAFGWQSAFAFLLAAGIGVFALTYFDLGETAKGTGMKFSDQIKTYPELFRSVRFWGYVACTAFCAGAFYALLGGASFVAGTVFELSPSMTGVALGAPSIGYLFGNFLSGRYSVKLGINKLALFGCSITVSGLIAALIVTTTIASHPFVFFGFTTVMGLGNGLTMPNATSGSLSVRPHLAGTASGLGAAIMMAGGAGLSALAGSLLDPAQREVPLLIIMLISASLSLLSIILVIYRDRRIGSDLLD
nr:Bcr/CflA family multidrug resistance transporter [uncultured bacterium]